MSLRNRKGIWHYRFKFDGKEQSGTTRLAATERNTMAALRKEAEHRQALMEGRRVTRRIIVRLFVDAAADFLNWAKAEYHEHPNSYRRLKTSFASLTEFFLKEAVSLIDEGKIEAYKTWRINEHRVRGITLRHDLHALSKFFGYAMKQRWCRDNPCRLVTIPSDADAVRIHVINEAEERLYFQRASRNQNLHDVARLMLLQGMRPEEVESLEKPDTDFDSNTVRIRRGKSKAARRTLNLTGESRQILGRRVKGDSRWLFPSPRRPGEHISKLNSTHNAVCRRAGLNFVLYDFRHTFATRMAQAGTDLATLAAILGHSSLRSVQRYVHPTAQHQREAMARYDAALQASDRRERVQ